MKTAILAFLGTLFCAGALFSQNAPQNVPMIDQLEGDVLDSVAGTPVAGAYVSIQSGPNGPKAISDSNGHFRFAGPLQQASALQTQRAGYIDKFQQVASKPGEKLASVRIELVPQSVIFGKITDEDGFPVADANVEILRYQTIDGRMQLGMVRGDHTNDRGEFRAYNLPAGRYYVRLNSNRGSALFNWDSRYGMQFYPGTLEPGDSGIVEVKTGEQRSIEFHAAKQHGATVTGQVLMPGGQVWAPAGNGMLSPVPMVSLRVNSSRGYNVVGTAPVLQRDGSFSLPQIPPGSYTLEARIGNFNTPEFLAMQQIEVGSSDQRGITLTLHAVAPVDIAGTLAVEGKSKPGAFAIGLRAVGMGSTPSAVSNEDGTFVVKGVLPGHYNVMVMPDRSQAGGTFGGNPVSVRYGDREAVHDGFDFDGTSTETLQIKLVASTALLSGTLLNAAGQPASFGSVLFQGDDDAHRAWIRTETDGTFQTAMPPGKYHIYAVLDLGQMQNLEDPDYRQAHGNDFPLLQVVDGKNPAVALRMPAK
jgi:hypothetical protein